MEIAVALVALLVVVVSVLEGIRASRRPLLTPPRPAPVRPPDFGQQWVFGRPDPGKPETR